MNKRQLTDRQASFCREYVLDFNATQAAIRAGYSKNGAAVQASQLLTNPNVQSHIATLAAKVCDKAEITAEEVLKGIKGIATSKESRDGDRLKAWELLGKYLKLFTDKVEVSASDSLLDAIERGRKLAK